jgi:hypothetical protein
VVAESSARWSCHQFHLVLHQVLSVDQDLADLALRQVHAIVSSRTFVTASGAQIEPGLHSRAMRLGACSGFVADGVGFRQAPALARRSAPR